MDPRRKNTSIEELEADVRVRAKILDGTRWANEFSWDEIASMVRYMRLRHVGRGEVLFKEGDGDPSLYILAEGTVDVLRHDTRRRPKRIARLGPGQTIGEMSLIDDGLRSATVVAVEECVCLILSQERLNKMLKELPVIAFRLVLKIARNMSLRLRQTSGVLAENLQTDLTPRAGGSNP